MSTSLEVFKSLESMPTISAVGGVQKLQELVNSFLPIIQPMFKDEKLASRFLQSAFQAANSPLMQKCDPISVFGAIVNCASIGLTINPALGQAYLVPYNEKKTGADGREFWQNSAQLQIGYKGYVDKLFNTGQVMKIEADVVCKGDIFDFEQGTNAFIKHKPSLDRLLTYDNILASYAIVTLREGNQVFQVISKAKIEQLRMKNKQQVDRKTGDTSPKGVWAEWYDRQSMKSALRQLVPYLPMSENLEILLSLDDTVHTQVDGVTVLEKEKIEIEPKPKPEMCPTYKGWKGCCESLKIGGTTIESLETFFVISDENKAFLASLLPLNPSNLPEMNPEHEGWNAAKEAVQRGTFTIEQIQKKYYITPENIVKLTTDAI